MPHLYNEQPQYQTPQRPPHKVHQTGKDWQIDFTVTPSASGNFRYLLVLVDTFSGWVEVFPTRSEMAAKVAKVLLKEIISRFGLPGSLQTDNGPAFVSQVTKGITSALGLKCTLHSAWRPQLSGKVERSNQTLKWTLVKLCQETQENRIKLLSTAVSPKG